METEYIELSQAMQYIIHLRILIQEVGNQLKMDFSNPAIMYYTVFEDNNIAIFLATPHRKTPRKRHIAVKYNLFREHVDKGKGIMIHSMESKEHKADVFTKVLPGKKNQHIRKFLAGWRFMIIQKQGGEREKG